MKPKTLITIGITALLLVTLCITPAAAADDTPHKITPQDITNHIKNRIADWWDGWTFDKSQYALHTKEWIADVKQHIRDIVTDKRKSFEDRAKAQAYALGWDERFDYVEKYGTIDEETGRITYDVPILDTLFGGLKFRERWFTTEEDYNTAMNIYNENYNAAVQEVPTVIA